MESLRIAELLRPFTGEGELSGELLEQLQGYLDLLLKWNARMNLTAVRDAEQIVTRHFGESLFGARVLLGDPESLQAPFAVADVGSGAGFPGIPIKLWSPRIQLTLIESQNKKATFLREVIRTLKLEAAEVFCGRAEEWGKAADLVTLRAVEKFERVLPVAADLVAPGGRLGLFLGGKQLPAAREIVGELFAWQDPIAIPQSGGRVVAIAARR
jgi:16S rRNA (guanine527-N7)-methyltransferase